MKSLLCFTAVLLLFFIGISCSNSDDSPTPTPTPVIVTFNAALTPVSGTGSMASGNAELKYNQTAKTFEITVTFTGITPKHGHIHAADGAIVFPFPDAVVGTSPIKLTFDINDAQITELMANHYYVNLHTDAFPTGEISGTLIKAGTSGGGGGGGY
ncbi:CHRD domain-containing protein [Flavobacterium aquicola]|uniref:CHRD domain-containing protein n=1 Tax=Flavobacterium aquicola TaxID=1682742 RepID=A0A3E0ENJ8_9FLAO|nr:CHRD domain-containing protein [Flavobacterium aquicola]REG99758.1 CHRD domain-containing protein [Flavobacterium aquicola]